MPFDVSIRVTETPACGMTRNAALAGLHGASLAVADGLGKLADFRSCEGFVNGINALPVGVARVSAVGGIVAGPAGDTGPGCGDASYRARWMGGRIGAGTLPRATLDHRRGPVIRRRRAGSMGRSSPA